MSKNSSNFWKEYKLIDFGNGVKIEKYGVNTLIRPETAAKKQLNKNINFWEKQENIIIFDKNSNKWNTKQKEWIINYKSTKIDIKLKLFLSNSKHIGVFPEQVVNWEYIAKNLNQNNKFLNLFAYTGAASIVAAMVCKQVTHVDSSHSIIKRAKENAEINKINNIRFINDDALLFCTKEAKRNKKYKGIILDPPVYGYGTKGKSWKLTKDLRKLLETIKKLIDKDFFIILNTYSPSLNNTKIMALIKEIFGKNIHLKLETLILSDTNKNNLKLNDYYIITPIK